MQQRKSDASLAPIPEGDPLPKRIGTSYTLLLPLLMPCAFGEVWRVLLLISVLVGLAELASFGSQSLHVGQRVTAISLLQFGMGRPYRAAALLLRRGKAPKQTVG